MLQLWLEFRAHNDHNCKITWWTRPGAACEAASRAALECDVGEWRKPRKHLRADCGFQSAIRPVALVAQTPLVTPR
jgi:hypothetical protein